MNLIYKPFTLFIILLLLPFMHSLGQNIRSANITWNCTQATDGLTSKTTEYNGSFISTGDTNVDWVQNNGQKTYHLSVVSVEGGWADVSTDGSIVYNLGGTTPGQLTFERINGVLTIRLFIKPSKSSTLNYTFSIDSLALN
ncbi:MAG: hypothetical protein HOP30_18985 [Cyclobacteriaceae bacterium]|nr:hypothetical protein [Cyclobacteriaceae bacterium]